MNTSSTLETLQCRYCTKICKNNNSLAQHEIRCKLNPARINVTIEGFNNSGRRAWNADKTAETDCRVKQHRDAVKKYYETHPGTFTGKSHDNLYKNHMSNIAKERELGGFNMRKSGIVYNNIKLDSSYEVEVAKSLDEHVVQWVRPKRIPYHYADGSLHYYTPDFYLPDYDVYLDPKNDYLIEHVNEFTGMTDVEKIQRVMNENNIKIIILDKNSLTWNKIKELI